MRLTSVTRNLTVAAATFLVYGGLAGLFVTKADFFPASILNYRAFVAVAGFPIQVLRALCAVVAAWSIIRMLDVFRWETQENLRISELRCATIASAMPVFLFMTDRNMVVTFVQGKGLEALGLSPEQVRGRHISDVFPIERGFCGELPAGAVRARGRGDCLDWRRVFRGLLLIAEGCGGCGEPRRGCGAGHQRPGEGPPGTG